MLPNVGERYTIPITGPSNITDDPDFVETRRNGNLEGEVMVVTGVDEVPQDSVLYEGHSAPTNGGKLYAVKGTINTDSPVDTMGVVAIVDGA